MALPGHLAIRIERNVNTTSVLSGSDALLSFGNHRCVRVPVQQDEHSAIVCPNDGRWQVRVAQGAMPPKRGNGPRRPYGHTA